MSSLSSNISSVRSSLQSAASRSSSASSAYGGLHGTISSGNSAAGSTESAGADAYNDTEEIDSSSAGYAGRSSAGSGQSAASSGQDKASDIRGLGSDVASALNDALSSLRGVDGDTGAVRSAIESALSSQSDSRNGADAAKDALSKASWCLSRAADDAGYVANDEPGKNVSNYGYGMKQSGYEAGGAFSAAGGYASSGESAQNATSRAISAAQSELNDLERQWSSRELELRSQEETSRATTLPEPQPTPSFSQPLSIPEVIPSLPTSTTMWPQSPVQPVWGGGFQQPATAVSANTDQLFTRQMALMNQMVELNQAHNRFALQQAAMMAPVFSGGPMPFNPFCQPLMMQPVNGWGW